MWSRQGEGSTFTIELPVAPTTVEGPDGSDNINDEAAVVQEEESTAVIAHAAGT